MDLTENTDLTYVIDWSRRRVLRRGRFDVTPAPVASGDRELPVGAYIGYDILLDRCPNPFEVIHTCAFIRNRVYGIDEVGRCHWLEFQSLLAGFGWSAAWLDMVVFVFWHSVDHWICLDGYNFDANTACLFSRGGRGLHCRDQLRSLT